ncbi:hypothetical protein ACOSOMT5_P2972 [Acidiphilium sp. MT5]
MTERPKFFDDLAGVAGGALSALNGLRDELTALARARVDEAIARLDLVRREEFDAMAELARRARAEAEALSLRVAALEQRFAAMPEAMTTEVVPPETPSPDVA